MTYTEIIKSFGKDIDLIDLINRQQEKIERLKDLVRENEGILPKYENLVKSEAVKEFAERLKEKSFQSFGNYGITRDVVEVCDIDNLIKEMVGDKE